MTINRQALICTLIFLLLAIVPVIASLTDVPFYLDLARRMMILASRRSIWTSVASTTPTTGV